MIKFLKVRVRISGYDFRLGLAYLLLSDDNHVPISMQLGGGLRSVEYSLVILYAFGNLYSPSKMVAE